MVEHCGSTNFAQQILRSLRAEAMKCTVKTSLLITIIFTSLARCNANAYMECKEYRPCLLPGEEFPYVSKASLRNISEKLFKYDIHNAGKYIRINYQSQITVRNRSFYAKKKFLEVGDAAFKIPTINNLSALLDNYNEDSTEEEDVTRIDVDEEDSFLTSILDTSVMKAAYHFLLDKGQINRGYMNFLGLLIETWFKLFPRHPDAYGSSAFEGVFVGEINDTTPIGVGNWVYFDNQEKNRRLHYMGYTKRINLGKRGAIVSLRYKWRGMVSESTLLVGTSPELEVALYTICYLTRPNKPCPLSIKNNKVTCLVTKGGEGRTESIRSASLRI